MYVKEGTDAVTRTLTPFVLWRKCRSKVLQCQKPACEKICNFPPCEIEVHQKAPTRHLEGNAERPVFLEDGL